MTGSSGLDKTRQLLNGVRRSPLRCAQACLSLALLLAGAAPAQQVTGDWNGHAKLRALADTYPDGSIFRALAGSSSADMEGDMRLNASAGSGPWSIEGSYQFYAARGDGVKLAAGIPGAAELLFRRFPNDTRRLFDLTRVIADSDESVVLHRLDRVAIAYAGENLVVKLGRQALSWGNGLFFSPLDIVNPFDPATVDTEYKAGDDMAYGQLLLRNGNDVQAAHVWRRDPVTGNVDADEATTALKYHGLTERGEYELLVARSFDATTLAVGGNRSVGGAIWRADMVLTDAGGWTAEFVTNLSYSWTWSGKNVSGAIEYYYNGFGQGSGAYSLAEIVARPELAGRLARGQAFSVGRHYVAAGLTVELTPLWLLTPNLFMNVTDPSALLQVVTQYSLGDNLSFLGALNLQLGADGTEFGGIPAGPGGGFLSRDAGLFAQFAWYF